MAEPGFRLRSAWLQSPCHVCKVGPVSYPVSPSQGFLVLVIHLEFPNTCDATYDVPLADCSSPGPLTPHPHIPENPFPMKFDLIPLEGFIVLLSLFP